MKIYILVSAFALSACASSSQVLKSDLKPQVLISSEMKPLEKFSKIEKVDLAKANLKIIGFEDNRRDRSAIGRAKTGMTNNEVNVQLDININDHFKNRFISGLTERGVNVIDDTTYGLRGKILKFWVSENSDGKTGEYSSCELELNIEVVKNKTGQPVYVGTLASEATGTNSILDTTDSNGPVLETCMSSVLNKIVKDKNMATFLASGKSKK